MNIEIRLTALHKSFDDHAVLQGVDLVVKRGDVVAVVGGSGCGKTVLLEHILGLETPDRGRVEVADHTRDGAPLVDLADMDGTELDRLHAHWGMVFQRNALFSGSVFDNIALPLREVKRLKEAPIGEIVARALQAVGLPTDEDFLEKDHADLSGGMAKRLAVARAVAMEPQVIFYDEPTTGLDPVSASQIQDLIHETHHIGRSDGDDERTTLIITHDKDLLTRLRPRTVMLFEGKVFFDGPFEAFAESDSPIIRPYFERMPMLQLREIVAA